MIRSARRSDTSSATERPGAPCLDKTPVHAAIVGAQPGNGAGRMAQSHGGKVAIVTGAGRGLGRAMALGLLSAGAQVVAVDADASVLGELRATAERDGAAERILTGHVDISREDDAQ